LFELSNAFPVFDVLSKRVLSFITKCVNSDDYIFGKVGRLASEDVTIQLIRTKCLPVLYYGLEACPVTKAQTKSLDYACFRKIF